MAWQWNSWYVVQALPVPISHINWAQFVHHWPYRHMRILWCSVINVFRRVFPVSRAFYFMSITSIRRLNSKWLTRSRKISQYIGYQSDESCEFHWICRRYQLWCTNMPNSCSSVMGRSLWYGHGPTCASFTRHINIPTLIARFMGPTWSPSRADSTQVGPMLAPWTLLSG